jgi:hypothetical protein
MWLIYGELCGERWWEKDISFVTKMRHVFELYFSSTAGFGNVTAGRRQGKANTGILHCAQDDDFRI